MSKVIKSKSSPKSSDVTISAAALASQAEAPISAPVAAVHITLSKGHQYQAAALAKIVDDARAAVGRLKTDSDAGDRIAGSAKQGTLTLMEGVLLRAPVTATEKRAVAVLKASIALHRALSAKYSDD